MLDLNLDIVSSESSCDEFNNNTTTNTNNEEEEDEEMIISNTETQMEYSATSTSSIINTDEALTNNNPPDENSSNTTTSSAFIFDIFKKDDSNIKNPSHLDFLTDQLFPQRTGLELNLRPPPPPQPGTTRPQWLKLSQVEIGGEAELRIVQQKQQQVRKSRRGPRSRSSQYRGVTFYRRTGRWESHIWDCGKQVYLGGFDTAHAAARAYDRAAIKFRGVDADINFNLTDYDEDMKQMRNLNKEEFVHILRRQSNGFSRGTSKYRGVTLHKCGRWEARMGQFLGKKAYDKAAIKCNGREAVTNFEPSFYEGKVVFNSNAGGAGHNLDLSLGISTPPENNIVGGGGGGGGFQFQCVACEMPNKVVESAASNSMGGKPLHGLPIKSKNLAICTGAYPGLSSGNEERGAADKRIEAASALRFSSWPWQINGSNNAISSQVSVAASSGFGSSSGSATSSATFQLNQQQKQYVNNNNPATSQSFSYWS